MGACLLASAYPGGSLPEPPPLDETRAGHAREHGFRNFISELPSPWMRMEQREGFGRKLGSENSFLDPPPFGWNKGRDTAEN